MSHTIREALRDARRQLAAQPEADPRLEAEILLGFTLGKERSHLHAWPDKPLEAPQLARFQELLIRRTRGEPIAYITGRREFWSLELTVTPATLIPRPETEQLVECALQRIPPGRRWHIADLGTGSGAIAAAIASERPACRIIATDRSAAAIDIARENFQRLNLPNVHIAKGAWCAALPPDERFDLILSNPPYIPNGDPHLDRGDLRREPRSALVSGSDGLDDIRRILKQSPGHLTSGGWLLLEHGCDQGPEVRELFAAHGFSQITTRRDLAGRERLSEGRWFERASRAGIVTPPAQPR